MKSDLAMWASHALADYLRLGISLEETRSFYVARTLAGILKLCNLEISDRWYREVGDRDREYLVVVIERVTGRIVFEIRDEIAAHADEVREAIDSGSWDKMRVLPERVWYYLSSATGMSVSEWDDLPDFCRQLLSEWVLCPVCGWTRVMENFGEPDKITDPFDFEVRKVCLVFHCQSCGTRVTYDIQRKHAEEFAQPLILRSRPYRWAVIAIFAMIFYFLVRLIFR